MKISTLQHFALQSAYLCPDCNTIGNCANQCPACASRTLMGLSAILDREIVEERKPVAQMPSAHALPRYKPALVA